MCALRDVSDEGAPGAGIKFGKRNAIDKNAARARFDKAKKQGEQRALAAAAWADKRDVLAPSDLNVDSVQRRRAAVINDAHALELQSEGCRRRQPTQYRRPRRDRSIKEGDDAFGRRHRFHLGVAFDAERANGRVELRRQQQDEEADVEIDLAPHQAKADEHRGHRDRDRGEELQHQRREKSDAQHRHRIAAIGLGHFRDDGDFAFRRAEELEFGQALHGVEQVAAEPRERRPLPRVRSLRALSDEDQEDDRKRQGHAENRARDTSRAARRWRKSRGE